MRVRGTFTEITPPQRSPVYGADLARDSSLAFAPLNGGWEGIQRRGVPTARVWGLIEAGVGCL